MANRRKQLMVSESDRVELERRVRSKTIAARDAQRARIILVTWQGCSGIEIAEMVGVSEPTVVKWRARYEQHGLEGLEEKPRCGRVAHVVDEAKELEVVWLTMMKGAPEVVVAGLGRLGR